ncbi:type IV toxin-antitoxin system AbiEi family antitoxin domain-containing protein [Anaerorudis cellulosivorans]|uniref:type IV toxin-antitoxin system AbiEi family antitoxin domain-containing protein n=1 Tax=Anaerorudis cellulosivorans TaxID=3397862 RepID=UPI0022202CC5|nr:type IV toxin-antitoxin system AbiEi family antitoxin domain-containing protein [Seramator thermalis]MCW1734152.1 type IV toxin-antitoxin system AbiEi family antitoxin domain-containing protein [Seramator thermalis]
MKSTNDEIIKYIKRNRRGKIFFADEFRKFGSNEAVRQSLSRLCKKNFLVRLSVGIYLYPQIDSEIGIVFPSIENVAKTIAKREKTRMIPTGAYALNALGLSTQVPAKAVFLTDGTPRVVKVGKNATIKFKRTVAKNLSYKGKISLLAISALKEIGNGKATAEQLQIIKEALQQEKRENIIHDAAIAPVWISNTILKLIENE